MATCDAVEPPCDSVLCQPTSVWICRSRYASPAAPPDMPWDPEQSLRGYRVQIGRGAQVSIQCNDDPEQSFHVPQMTVPFHIISGFSCSNPTFQTCKSCRCAATDKSAYSREHCQTSP